LAAAIIGKATTGIGIFALVAINVNILRMVDREADKHTIPVNLALIHVCTS
jgi:hypothetical protein